jgi:co-chaperonin GroES (HSP10)
MGTEVITGIVRPLGARIIVKPLEWRPSEVIEVVRSGRPLRGAVVAVGPGEYPKKYRKDANGNRTSFEYSRHFQPTEVRVGDIVELGGLNVFDGHGYQFSEIVIGTETHLVCSEKDVCLVESRHA